MSPVTLPEDLRKHSDRELLAVIYGGNADLMYEECNGSLARVLRETSATYSRANTVLHAAREIVARALREELRDVDCLGSPSAVKSYLTHHLACLEHEVFVMLALDAQNRLIRSDTLFSGSLKSTSVYPREVVKRALACNCAGAIFAHNHPSGVAEPSRADELLTRALKSALALIDVSVLDHIICAGGATLSFAERGLL